MASREKNSSDSSESHKAHTAEINGDSNNCADKRVNGSGKHFGLFIFRPHDDDEEQDWWFASTAIPLIAATIAPLANVLSIAARVVSWRMSLIPDNKPVWDGTEALLSDLQGFPFDDPQWMLDVNVVSLVFGFLGNLMLLANFTSRIRYIIALPASIIAWYISTGLLIAITVSMNTHYTPDRPTQTYTQGFWYGVIAAVLYLVCSMILMVNMLGYFLGHYPQRFNLTESQRTLLLQSILFFLWLAGGAAIFSTVEIKYGNQRWLFTDALYFCDVTILTVGFGDEYPEDDIGRGLVFPYSVGGIIMLGLMIGSISKFAGEISQEKVIGKRVERHRQQTIKRSTLEDVPKRADFLETRHPPISRPYSARCMSKPVNDRLAENHKQQQNGRAMIQSRMGNMISKANPRRLKHKSRALLLREEKDRFDAMRAIQKSTKSFKQWSALTISVIVFGILWCLGAVVFWKTEQKTQGLSYFQALYFCYVSLLTIGYGDLAPKSNAGRPFFVVWSLLAVPTMTILVSDMGDTIISRFQRGTSTLADFTVLPKYGIWRDLLNHFPKLVNLLQSKADERAAQRRLQQGMQTGPEEGIENEEEGLRSVPTIEQLAKEESPASDHELVRKLAQFIRSTANDMKHHDHKRYTYEEWVEITQLIRFTSKGRQLQETAEEDEDGLVKWDWIGENSPMMAGKSEPEFVLHRLCESMSRYARLQAEHFVAAFSASDAPRNDLGIMQKERKKKQDS